MEQDASDETRTESIAHSFETSKIFRLHRRAWLHFHTSDPSWALFENEVDLCLILVSIVADGDSIAAKRCCLAQFTVDETLQECAKGLPIA